MKMAMAGAQPLTCDLLPRGQLGHPPFSSLELGLSFPYRTSNPASLHMVFNKYFHSTGF